MNFLQLGLFIVFVFASLAAGLGIISFIAPPKDQLSKNKIMLLAEALLFGSSLIVGELMLLSVVHLYQAPYLQIFLFLNLLFFFGKSVRELLQYLLTFRWSWNVWRLIFLALL